MMWLGLNRASTRQDPLLVCEQPPPTRSRDNAKAVLLLASLIAATFAATALLTRSPPPSQPLAAAEASGASCAPGAPTVLITGFEPFGTLRVNPAEVVARKLNGTCARGARIETWVLPVSHSGASRVAEALRRGVRWDAVIHLGAEDVAKGLRLEVAAANVLAREDSHAWSTEISCNKSGSLYENIDDALPCLYATTAPLERLVLPTDAAREFLWPSNELWSRDAGSFYCNEALFKTLSTVRSLEIKPLRVLSSLLPVIFVHLPVFSVSEEHHAGLASLIETLAANIIHADEDRVVQLVGSASGV